MIWLALSIGTMWLLAIVARWGEARNQDRLMMMAWNYLVAGALSGVLAWWSASPAVAPLTGSLGIAAGISYALALLLWMIAIPLAGLGVSTTAMRLAVVWPAAVSVLVFGERLTALQTAGIVLALAAMAMLLRAGSTGLRRGVSGLRRSVSGLRPSVSGLRPIGPTGLLWLLALWASSGANGALLKVFTELGDPAQRAPFLAVIYRYLKIRQIIPGSFFEYGIERNFGTGPSRAGAYRHGDRRAISGLGYRKPESADPENSGTPRQCFLQGGLPPNQ